MKFLSRKDLFADGYSFDFVHMKIEIEKFFSAIRKLECLIFYPLKTVVAGIKMVRKMKSVKKVDIT